MEIHDRQDLNLTALATSSSSTSTAVSSDEVIDITEKGGIENAQYVVEVPSADKALTVAIVGDSDPAGLFGTTVASFTTTANTAMEVRERIPLNAPRYWKLTVTTDGTAAPTTAVTAKLTVRV